MSRPKGSKNVKGIIEPKGLSAKERAVVIIGYGFEKGDKWPLPIFKSEKDSFRGKLYQTVNEAKEAMK